MVGMLIIISWSYVRQEEELRKGGEAKYAHLAMELHVFIEVMAPIPEAYMRMAHAMEEVKKFLIPVCTQDNLLHPNYRNILCTSNICIPDMQAISSLTTPRECRV